MTPTRGPRQWNNKTLKCPLKNENKESGAFLLFYTLSVTKKKKSFLMEFSSN